MASAPDPHLPPRDNGGIGTQDYGQAPVIGPRASHPRGAQGGEGGVGQEQSARLLSRRHAPAVRRLVKAQVNRVANGVEAARLDSGGRPEGERRPGESQGVVAVLHLEVDCAAPPGKGARGAVHVWGVDDKEGFGAVGSNDRHRVCSNPPKRDEELVVCCEAEHLHVGHADGQEDRAGAGSRAPCSGGAGEHTGVIKEAKGEGCHIGDRLRVPRHDGDGVAACAAGAWPGEFWHGELEGCPLERRVEHAAQCGGPAKAQHGRGHGAARVLLHLPILPKRYGWHVCDLKRQHAHSRDAPRPVRRHLASGGADGSGGNAGALPNVTLGAPPRGNYLGQWLEEGEIPHSSAPPCRHFDLRDAGGGGGDGHCDLDEPVKLTIPSHDTRSTEPAHHPCKLNVRNRPLR
mmetsp:Transcript_17368/g.43728  ORF Transcript_17368/g.43728 Transcript_17368/m.43728 type:complete len:403 (-) Transcript_17368:4732-5940(-)